MGFIYTVLYNILSALKEVFVADKIQGVDSFSLVFWVFLIVAVLFILLYNCLANNQKTPTYTAFIKNNKKNIIIVNITTTFSWITAFYSLKYLEPAVSAIINTSIAPVITVLFLPLIIANSSSSRLEKIASFGILLVLIFLVRGIFEQDSVAVISYSNSIFGILGSIVCGIAIALNTIYSKKIINNGGHELQILSTRFTLLIIVSLIIILLNDSLLDIFYKIKFYNIIIIAFIGVAMPLYFLQKGITKLDPLKVSLIIACSPLFTFVFELPYERIKFSVESLLGISLIVCITVFTMLHSSQSKLKKPQ